MIKTGHSCVYNIEYHIVWCVKYRHKILSYQDIEKRVKEIIYDIADKNNIQIIEIETDKDHIHMLISCTPQHYIPDIIQKFKGVTSNKIRKEFKHITKKYFWGKNMWNRSYFVATVSENTKQQIQEYIQNQKFDRKG